MSSLPLAVRIAAGLAATAVERARRLPQDLAELPVTAVSRAMQASMRLQQQLTELAIKGDNAIALLRTPAEDPPWAVFDEDNEGGLYRLPDRADRATGATGADQATPSAQDAARDWYEAEYAAATAADETAYLTETADLTKDAYPTKDAATTGDGGTVADDSTVAEDLAAPTDIGGPPTFPADSETLTADLGALTADPATDGSRTETDNMRTETDDTPGALPGYGGLSLASVRARLRTLDVSGLQELLDYEQAHANRPEFVRMLTNRISTVRNR